MQDFRNKGGYVISMAFEVGGPILRIVYRCTHRLRYAFRRALSLWQMPGIGGYSAIQAADNEKPVRSMERSRLLDLRPAAS